MRVLLFLLIPYLTSGQSLITQNSNSYLTFADSSISPSKVSSLATLLNAKQNSLVSGTSLKTINGTTLLGSGDIVVGAGSTTATVGVANCPTATGTQTITHNLGRTPTIIEIYGVGRFTSNAAATPTPFSLGTWTSLSGNTCIYMTTAGTTTQDGLSSTTFSVFIATSSGNNMSGIIQNVGATSFDIAWTETGTAAALPFRWKAQ